MIQGRYIITFILLLCFIPLSACHKTVSATDNSEDVQYTSTPTQTITATLSESPADRSDQSIPSPTVTATITPTPTPFCIQLIEPLDGVELPNMGKVTFSWHSTVNADCYILEFITPSGEVVSFITNQTSIVRYIESLSAPGSYIWQVLALDADNNHICVSPQLHFTKGQSPYTKDNPSKNGIDFEGDSSASDDAGNGAGEEKPGEGVIN